MKDIIVEFSGWVRIAPENAKFINIDTIVRGWSNLDVLADEKHHMSPIDGLQWLALSKEEREDYILKNVIDAQRDADDGDYNEIRVFEDDSP